MSEITWLEPLPSEMGAYRLGIADDRAWALLVGPPQGGRCPVLLLCAAVEGATISSRWEAVSDWDVDPDEAARLAAADDPME